MRTIHLITHTHWDREWYLTFQQFRLKLVHMMDKLLAILETEPGFANFMLDGQTIMLDDYLEIRPERLPDLRKYISTGRLSIGPWYISPDEFLAAPESHLRNLLEGKRRCQGYGSRMMVGYLPDTFGHIGQLPQILQGFGISTACVWRGIDDQPCELDWVSPDGSLVLLAFLRDSYSNAASLTTSDPGEFSHEVQELSDALANYSLTDQILLMNGTDHMEPSAKLSKAVSVFQSASHEDRLIHSSLPYYLDNVRSDIKTSGEQLPKVCGELRSSKRMPLLQNVLSTRIVLKQRNQACEIGLLKWVEPFAAWSELMDRDEEHLSSHESNGLMKYLTQPLPVIQHAWQLLMQCHPHDSICGTSIDQVVREMETRFDQVDQINQEMIGQSLRRLCDHINTSFDHGPINADNSPDMLASIVVFNPNDSANIGIVSLDYKLPYGYSSVELVDTTGNIIPHQQDGMGQRELINMVMDKKSLRQALGVINEGNVAGMVIKHFEIQQQGERATIQVTISDHGTVDWEAWKAGIAKIEESLADPMVQEYLVHATSDPEISLSFIARDIPGHGYQNYWIRGISQQIASVSRPVKLNPIFRVFLPAVNTLSRTPLFSILLHRRERKHTKPPFRIENEYFVVEAQTTDGTLSIVDKRNDQVYQGLNRFIDNGDCGDLYNFCPPMRDEVFSAQIKNAYVETCELYKRLIIHYRLVIPRCISEDRKSRSRELVNIDLMSEVTLVEGLSRIDINTQVNNAASDHRLRVHFPAPFRTSTAWYDGHFEIIQRPIGLPAYDAAWEEPPRPEVPQREFTCITGDHSSLMIANRGLPEVEVFHNASGNAEISLTLLRCVGWLSRDDITTRKGHAGPMGIETPQAQMHGTHNFAYSIIPGDENWRPLIHHAQAFNAPLRAVDSRIHPGLLPSSCSMIRNSCQEFLITAIKLAEDGPGLIIRGFNSLPTSIDVVLKAWRKFNRAQLVSLDESPVQDVSISANGEINFHLEGYKIATLCLSD